MSKALPLTHYIIIREDLPSNIALVQAIHAASESGPTKKGDYAIALAAIDEPHLEQIESQLISHNIPHISIREPDEPYCGQIMAIGLVPVQERKSVRRVVGKLKLVTRRINNGKN